MSNEPEARFRFRCLICSTSSPRLGVGLTTTVTDKTKDDRKNLYKTFLVLHKILQIPMWECAGYLLSTGENGQNVTNALKLCSVCADKVDQGRSILERVEGLQAQLQTLQATLQNQVLSSQNQIQGDNEDEDQTQNKIRNTIRGEIRKNVDRSTRGSNYVGGDDIVGTYSVSTDATRDPEGNSRTPAGSTPVLAEETAATEEEEVEQNHLRLEIELGEIKTEQELGRDPLAFSYEVIDLASDNDEASTEERGQDLDSMVDEVTRGELFDVNQSQPENRTSWSTQSSPSPNIRRDSSPLPIPPQSKRLCISVQDNHYPPTNSMISNSGTNAPAQAIGQQSPQPGPSRQYLPLYRTQSLPASASAQPNLLQMLLAPSSVPSPPSYASSVSLMPTKQIIWCGMMEWHERRKDATPPRGPHQIYCRVYSPVVNRLPSVNSVDWPRTLFMQCIPKPIMSATGPSILRQAKTVLFEFDQPASPEVQALTNALGEGGHAGCIHFVRSSSAIKILALVYIRSRNQFIGIIPEQQEVFVSTLKNVIQNYNQRQLQLQYAKQLATGQSPNPATNPNQPNGTTSISEPGNQNVIQQQQQSFQQWSQLQRTHQLPSQTVHHRPVATLSNSSLVTQRQLNLLKIQQLKQTLDQAQRTEMNFQTMQGTNNTVTTFSMQQSDQQQSNTFASFNANPNSGPN